METVNGEVTINEGGLLCYGGCVAFCAAWCYVGGGLLSVTMANLGIAAAYNV